MFYKQCLINLGAFFAAAPQKTGLSGAPAPPLRVVAARQPAVAAPLQSLALHKNDIPSFLCLEVLLRKTPGNYSHTGARHVTR
jgi:hypothetical protein